MTHYNRLISLVGIFLCANFTQIHADTTMNGEQFANVWRIHGEITASTPSSSRTLLEGDMVAVGERVQATTSGEAVLKTADAGYIAVRPGAEFVLERFAAKGEPSDNFTLRLIKGGLRVITGWIGRVNCTDHRIITPTATIGIRGTDHEPYVISADLAAILTQREGTYDKVNRGGTILDVNGTTLDINQGQVGFVKPRRSRALMTLLMPVLLDKVPDFYVPGKFDAELDHLAQETNGESAPLPPTTPATAAPEEVKSATTPQDVACHASKVARDWLRQLDRAITRRNTTAILALFAADVTIVANVRDGDGTSHKINIERRELAQSTIDAVARLKKYQQRRPVIEGKPAADDCERIAVRSVSIEEGVQAGKPYRFESLEEYLLEQRSRGNSRGWVAIKVETTQQ